MQLSVKIHKVFEDKEAMKAIASVTLDELFVVHGVKVIESEKGRFTAMPTEVFRDKGGNDSRRDIFHPISSSARKLMDEAVLAAYEEAAKNQAVKA